MAVKLILNWLSKKSLSKLKKANFLDNTAIGAPIPGVKKSAGVKLAGEWLIKPISNNETAIAYTWNGELLGDFPSWALPRAWKTQGNEIIDWLNEALSN